MRRTLSVIALFILAACCTACAAGPPTNTNSAPKKNAKITVHYPNLFLQDEPGKVTFALERVSGPVRTTSTSNDNTTQIVDTTDVNIWPQTDTDKYNVYIEVQLLATGLTKTDPPNLKRLYEGQTELWEWSLKPAEGMAEGAEVSVRFQVDVTWQAKTSDVSSREIPDVWQKGFRMKVGPPAAQVNAALYSSPVLASGGFLAFGAGVRRRKKLVDAELEGEEIEDEPMMASVGTGLEEEEVSSTVYAPGQAAQGDSFLVQVFVHLPEQVDSLDDIAREADEDAKRRITNKLQKKIRRGTELTFHLLMPGLDVDAPIQSCVWSGEPAWVQFGVTVPEASNPRNIIGTVTVSEASVPIGHLKFKFKITGDDVAGEADALSREPAAAGNMVRYQQAFISYASKDRPEVLKRVQMLNLAKIKFFQDLLTLEAGDPWEKLLYDYIDKSDVFFLFWSKAASESEWVKKEVEYAVRRKTGQEESGPEIIPVIIEGPPSAKPPAELSFLHFNDKLIYFINSKETEAKTLDG